MTDKLLRYIYIYIEMFVYRIFLFVCGFDFNSLSVLSSSCVPVAGLDTELVGLGLIYQVAP